MKLIIIRRAETNKDAGLPGDPAAPSPNGQAQIEAVAETCRSENVQAVIHPAVDRAVSTAEALALALNVPSFEQAGLEERNFGEWNEWEWSQIAAELDRLTTEERYTFVPPQGESWQQMEERLRNALQDIATLPYESVAVVTHWGSIRALLPMLNDEPKESTLQLNVANGQTFIAEYNTETE